MMMVMVVLLYHTVVCQHLSNVLRTSKCWNVVQRPSKKLNREANEWKNCLKNHEKKRGRLKAPNGHDTSTSQLNTG